MNKDIYYYQKIKLYRTLKEYVKMINYPLSFSKDLPLYNHNNNFNCYAYALGLRVIDNFPFLIDNGLSIYNPGTISDLKIREYNEDNLIKALFSDCDVLGLECKPTDSSSDIENNTSKIAVYIESTLGELDRDFHFARLNQKRIWSNMEGSGGPVFCLGRDINDIPGYDFLGTYTIRKKRI